MANEKIKTSSKRINLDSEVQYSTHVYGVHLTYSARYHCVGILYIYDLSNKKYGFLNTTPSTVMIPFKQNISAMAERGEGDGGCFGCNL